MQKILNDDYLYLMKITELEKQKVDFRLQFNVFIFLYRDCSNVILVCMCLCVKLKR